MSRIGQPIVVARGADRVDVFVLVEPPYGPISTWTTAWSGDWRDWRPMNAGFPIATEAVAVGDRLWAFGVGTEHNQWGVACYAVQGLEEDPWSREWGGAAIVGANALDIGEHPVCAVSRNAFSVDVFAVREDDRRIYTTTWMPPEDSEEGPHDEEGAWTEWQLIDPQFTSWGLGTELFGIARDSDSIDLFVIGAGKKVFTAAWTSHSGWAPFRSVAGGAIRGEPASTMSAFPVSRSPDHLDVFVVSEGRVWTAAWTSETDWIGWRSIDGINANEDPGAQVCAVSRTPHSIDVFAPGQLPPYAGHAPLWASWHDPDSNWSAWQIIEQASVYWRPIAVKRGPDAMDLYAWMMNNNAPSVAHWTRQLGWTPFQEIPPDTLPHGPW